MIDEGVNYDVHDWPTAKLGLKLGGFTVLRALVGICIAEEEKCSVRMSSRILRRLARKLLMRKFLMST
jgi:hypothetical protein